MSKKVYRVVDLGMLVDMNEACAAFRAFNHTYIASSDKMVWEKLGKAMRRLDRVRRFYNKKLRDAAKKKLE